MDNEELLTRGVVEVLPNKEGLKKLMAKKKIKVYLGVDPTGNRLHLGHAIPLKKLQDFADAGHETILVIGTGTVFAGDPSQRQEARKDISKEEVHANIKSWKEQAKKIVDFEKVQLKHNGDWLLKLNLVDVLSISSHISAYQLIKREMFQERSKKGDTVWMNEVLYPILQGYDSVELNVDLEIGGTDQVFNMLIGRELQKKMNNREKYVLTTPLIKGTDGNTMSKTSNNCIWLEDSPKDMFGKIMSLADSQIEEYAANLTDADITNLKPIDAKKALAFEIVKKFHSEEDAKKAQEEFENVFQKKEWRGGSVEVTTQEPGATLLGFVSEVTGSRSEAKRLISQGGVDIDGETAKDPAIELKSGQLVKIGKTRFLKIRMR